jgi:hypothetical protein
MLVLAIALVDPASQNQCNRVLDLRFHENLADMWIQAIDPVISSPR